ncbi:ERG2 and sigma1 receptor-like protein [Gonapodya prolifera JEL478]|uniref:C-8 sterol isomerase n=1 Tax=Gonapodya prolifera (strain JEL478) TaxID=1344416 RepID=A0A139A5B5_GONPJ|nr:ERG2 and sigma1 receptor-like protein [Gonapodya prolifera JEL478]|eukprot:KXS12007.1 ERG2 and sigma1 receptor-like protein [Gonapodya prolifera JEL478]
MSKKTSSGRDAPLFKIVTIPIPNTIRIPIPTSPRVVLIPLLAWTGLILAGIWVVHMYAFHWKTWLVDPSTIEKVARDALRAHPDGNLTVIFETIVSTLQQTYPGHVRSVDVEQDWIFMNAGGWMGSFLLLHASLTEYILLFGTAVPTSGHSGRYWADIHDTILKGSFTQWTEGGPYNRKFGVGDTIVHARGEVTAVSWPENTFMLEYARGVIPTTMGFALADSIFGTTDFVTVFNSVYVYGKSILSELARGNV